MSRSVKCILILSVVLAIPEGLSAFADCYIEEKDVKDGREIVIGNELNRLKFLVTAEGSPCPEWVLLPEGTNLGDPKAGTLMEWTGEFFFKEPRKVYVPAVERLKFEPKVVARGPARAVLSFSARMNVPETIYRQIVMTRTITMERGMAGFRLHYHFTNFGTALDLTLWFGCRISRASKSFYAPSSEGTRFCHDRDSPGGSYWNIMKTPADAWGAAVYHTGGGLAVLGEKQYLDVVQQQACRMPKEDNIELIYNRLSIDDEKDLDFDYFYHAFRGLPRVDVVTPEAVCGIELASETSRAKWKWPPPSRANTIHRDPWHDGALAKAGEAVDVTLHVAAARGGEVEVRGRVRQLPKGEGWPLPPQKLELAPGKAVKTKPLVILPSKGQYVAEFEIVRGKQVLAKVSRGFGVQGETYKQLADVSDVGSVGQVMVSDRMWPKPKFVKTLCTEDAKQLRPRHGPYILKIGPEGNTVWPGFTLVTDKVLYDAERGYGWLVGDPKAATSKGHSKNEVEARPAVVRGGIYPDSLTYSYVSGKRGHGARENHAVFRIDLKNGEYELFILSGDYLEAYPKSGKAALGTALDEAIEVQGQTVWQRKLTADEIASKLYYRNLSTVLRNPMDAWGTYVKPRFHEIRCSATVTDGTLVVRALRGCPLNVLMIYPSSMKARLDGVPKDLERARREMWLKPAKLPDPGPAPEAPAVMKERGYLVGTCAWDDDWGLYQNPPTSALGTEIRASGALGQTVTTVFAVRALRPLERCRIELGDLTGPGGARLPKESIRLLVKRYVIGAKYGEWMPQMDALMPAELDGWREIPVDPGLNRHYWLQVRVPKDAAPGDYTGTARFIPANAPATELKLSLHVHPFALDHPKDFIGFWWYSKARWPGATLERYLEDMWEHGMTLIRAFPTVQYDPDTGAPKMTDCYRWAWVGEPGTAGGVEVLSYQQVVDIAKRRGFLFRPLVLHLAMYRDGKAGRGRHELEKDPEKRKLQHQQWVDVYRETLAFFKEKGWGTPYLGESVGEGVHTPAQGEWLLATWRAINEAGGEAYTLAWERLTELVGQPRPRLAVKVIRGGHWLSEEGLHLLRRKQKEDGEKWAIYYCGGGYDFGVRLWLMGADGGTREGWSHAVYNLDDPYDLFDGFSKRGFLKSSSMSWHFGWPTPVGLAPKVRWEAYREGFTDYRYLYTLDQRIKAAKKSDNAQVRAAADRADAAMKKALEPFPVLGDENRPGAAAREALRARLAEILIQLAEMN